MRIIACITQVSVIDQILTHLRTSAPPHLRTRATHAARAGARSPPSPTGRNGRQATTRGDPPGALSRPPTPGRARGTFGVRVRLHAASDRPPL